MKKMSALLMAMVLCLSMTACGNGETAASDAALKEVTLVLDYVPNTNHTGIYAAQELGYFEAQGLNVKIIEPGDNDPTTLCAVGKAEFAVTYQENVTYARTAAEPLPIRAIAAIIQHNTSGFATAVSKNIASPKDFEGKVYSSWGGPGEEATIHAVMDAAGADFSKLDIVISDGSGFAALERDIDIMWFYEAWDNVKCQLAGFPINYMELRQFDERLDYYTPVIITSDAMIEKNPETVRKFLAATTKGYEYAIANPEESARILQQYAPDYDLEMLTLSQQYLSPRYAEGAPRWGEMREEVWNGYTDLLVQYGVLPEAIPSQSLYTNEFLPEAK